MLLTSRWHNYRLKNTKIYRRYGKIEKRERDAMFVFSPLSTHIFFDSCISLFAPFSSVSSTNCPHQQNAFNYKASAGLCPRNIKDYVVYTDYCEHGYVLRFVLPPSFLYLPFATRCILPWRTRFTSTAVISTAFTELINRAEGRVLLN